MYMMLPSWLRSTVLVVFGLFVYMSVFSGGQWENLISTATSISKLATGFLLTATFLFGWSGYFSPWRLLWRLFPALNQIAFPDLNGTWQGELKSNWPVLEQMRTKKGADAGNEPDQIMDGELLTVPIVCRIDASVFRIQISTEFPGSGNDSYATSATIERQSGSNQIILRHFFYQGNELSEDAKINSLTGAAELRLKFDNGMQLSGSYWTHRRWREGLNTAGLVSLKKVTEKR